MTCDQNTKTETCNPAFFTERITSARGKCKTDVGDLTAASFAAGGIAFVVGDGFAFLSLASVASGQRTTVALGAPPPGETR